MVFPVLEAVETVAEDHIPPVRGPFPVLQVPLAPPEIKLEAVDPVFPSR
jgi:hypothetical protein